MTPLGEEIAGMIRANGPVTLEHYMALALGHPRHGYYMTRDPLGAAGDFITAPEISQMFGELIGLWAAHVWSGMGAPAPVRLVELGPGRGTLMLDALRAARVAQEFFASLEVHMVETSPLLAQRQRETLETSGLPAHWHASFDDVPGGPAILIANEFFDALPVRHFVRTQMGWCERCVGLDGAGGLAFGLAPLPEPSIRTEAAEGAVLEIAAAGYRQMGQIARRLKAEGGAALVVDYGHAASGLGETLQALRAHQPVDPLADPGLADLTTHVDFAALARAAQSEGLAVQGPVGQGAFLAELGIFERAAALKRRASPEQVAAIESGLARLTQGGPGMGEMFKVLAVRPAGASPLPGFGGTGGANV